MAISCPTEAQEQRNLFRWAAYQQGIYPELKLMFHVANGGSRHPYEAHNLKEQGVKPGVPDIFLPVARGGYHGLFIELKRQKGGHVQECQQWYLSNLTRQGYKAIVCKGFEAARAAIEEYLKQ